MELHTLYLGTLVSPKHAGPNESAEMSARWGYAPFVRVTDNCKHEVSVLDAAKLNIQGTRFVPHCSTLVSPKRAGPNE
jgi:hypothetical protein